MKVLCSEFAPDYGHYRYPYVIWGFPEPGETPADLYAAGFHPASPNLDRFTLCRHLRVPLAGFQLSSENRRILRKGAGVRVKLVAREEFDYTSERREAWLSFAEARFGVGIMTGERLDGLMAGRVTTHLLVAVDDTLGGAEIGWVLLYVERPQMAHYYYAFYDRGHANQSLGLTLMTLALLFFREAGLEHLYLGTCYSERALYKVQFAGVEHFNGLTWSGDLRELRFLVRRDAQARHVLEEPEFLARHGSLTDLATDSRAGWRIPAVRPTPAGTATAATQL